MVSQFLYRFHIHELIYVFIVVFNILKLKLTVTKHQNSSDFKVKVGTLESVGSFCAIFPLWKVENYNKFVYSLLCVFFVPFPMFFMCTFNFKLSISELLKEGVQDATPGGTPPSELLWGVPPPIFLL